MFSKLNIKQLAILFLLLLAALAVVRIVDNRNDRTRSFKSEPASFVSDDVYEMVIYPKSATDKPVSLKRTETGWDLYMSGRQYSGSTDNVNNILQTLRELKTERLAANSKEKWEEYQVTDSTASRVVLSNKKGKTLLDLYIGKFSYTQPKEQQPNPYRQQQGKMTSFVRLAGKKEVLAVDGFIAMAFEGDLGFLRESTITKFDRNALTKIAVTHPADSSFVLEKQDNKWLLNGAETDSASVQQYLSALANLSSGEFYDADVTAAPVHSMLIEGRGDAFPIEIKGYLVNGENIVSSSRNKNSYFRADSYELFKKLFGSRPAVR